ncbi:SAM-dependent methyltransferase [Metallosphaera hakonensis]|uniref:Cobalt-precorrin-2 C(20)-methyltransferase n=1 Tax=Metallosphaera hakonensis JCM 8857 = DSM 7519 TaxID=1293036 RepID=A0A2U9IS74_9CREN|nr:precorrin-2 C(20)-methyltransferase [Metallosphaera hakonensis]AWR98866.1 cobalt-precorrin-2 C(20)-methyltransferase [Metallosphaera hakonensis JCM 8857 = DSM 7519]
MNLYGVGVGPGDPELVTMKALRLIRSADIVVVPVSSRRLTLNAVKPYLEGKEVLEFQLPVRRDRSEYLKLLEEVKSYNNVVYVTLGDPGFYSSVYRLAEFAELKEVVPGITSFSWCSSLHKTPISLGKERVLISPGDVDPTLYKADTYVLMKGDTSSSIRCGNGYFTVSIKRLT